MAKQLELKELSTSALQQILKACEIAFQKELKIEDFYSEGQTSWAIPDVGMRYQKTDTDNVYLKRYITTLTSESNTRLAYAKIYEEFESRGREKKFEKTESKEPPKTRPGTEELKTLEEQAEAKEEARAIAKEKGERQAQEFVEQRQKIAEAKKAIKTQIGKTQTAQAELKGKVIYAKVEIPEAPNLSQDEQKAYSGIKDLAQENPRQLEEDISQAIQSNVPETIKESSTLEEIKLYSDAVAARAVINLRLPTPPKPDIESAVLVSAATNKDTLQKTALQPESLKIAGQGINEIARMRLAVFQAPSNALDSIVGPNVRRLILGPRPNDEIKVTFVETPTEATHELDLAKLNFNYQTVLQNPILSFAEGEIKSRIIDFGKQQLVTKLNTLPTGSTIGKLAASEKFQGILTLLKPYTSFEFVGAEGFAGQIGEFVFQFSPESAPLLSGLGNIIGIDFGIVPVSSTVAPIATEAITTFGTSVVTEGAVTIATAGTAGVTTTVTAATTAAVTTTTTAVGAGTGAAVGQAAIPVPVIGAIIGAVLGFAASMLPKIKKWFTKHKEDIAIAGLALFGFGVITKSITLMISGGAFMIPILMGGAAVTALGSRLLFLSGAFARATVITIGKPILVTLLVFPVVVALILFIINSGAYVVPPSSSSFLFGHDNPYISVTKTANPDKADNPPPNREIEYTVTITALKSPLKNLKIVSTKCSVTKKDGSHVSCPPENIPALDPALTVSPTQPYSFAFNVEYDSKYVDALIYDSITISADAAEEAGITTSGSESVCIGDCPHGCFKVSDNALAWPGNLRSNMETALSELVSGFTKFTDRACSGGTEINLCYNPPRISSGYYAWHVHNAYNDNCDVYFNQKGVGSDRDALFLMTHELTHHIQTIDGGSVTEYRASGAYSEVETQGFCTYQDTKGSITESMAEADGLYATIPSWGGCVTDYKNQYPKNFMFAKGFME